MKNIFHHRLVTTKMQKNLIKKNLHNRVSWVTNSIFDQLLDIELA